MTSSRPVKKPRSRSRAHAARALLLATLCFPLALAACAGSYTPPGSASSGGEIRFGARRLTKGTVFREITVLTVRVPDESRSTDEANDVIERVVEERDGVAEALRVAFQSGTITRKGTEESDAAGIVSGKTYDVVRRGSNVEVTMADGQEAPPLEGDYVRKIFARLGGLRPISAALRARTWRIGDVGDRLLAPLREEVASKLTLEDAIVRLESLRRADDGNYAVFSVKGHVKIPRATRDAFPVEGELEVALVDATVSRFELRGRFKGEKPDSPWSEVLYKYVGQR
jgi:hypothetical protein